MLGVVAILVAQVVLDTARQSQMIDERYAGRSQTFAYLQARQRHERERPRLQPVQVAHRYLAVAPHGAEPPKKEWLFEC